MIRPRGQDQDTGLFLRDFRLRQTSSAFFDYGTTSDSPCCTD